MIDVLIDDDNLIVNTKGDIHDILGEISAAVTVAICKNAPDADIFCIYASEIISRLENLDCNDYEFVKKTINEQN